MKSVLWIISAIMVMLAVQENAWAYYETVDNLVLTYSGATDTASKNGDIYYRQKISVRNTGSQNLFDVGVLWEAVFSGSMFAYDDDTHRWERELVVGGKKYGEHWVESFTYDPMKTPGGKNDYFNLKMLNTPEQSVSAFDTAQSSISTASELPVYWLGDLDAGEETVFNLYFAQNESDYTGGGWSIQPVFSYMAQVSSVPIPSALLLLGAGIGIIGWIRSRSSRIQHSARENR